MYNQPKITFSYVSLYVAPPSLFIFSLSPFVELVIWMFLCLCPCSTVDSGKFEYIPSLNLLAITKLQMLIQLFYNDYTVYIEMFYTCLLKKIFFLQKSIVGAFIALHTNECFLHYWASASRPLLFGMTSQVGLHLSCSWTTWAWLYCNLVQF